MAINVTRSAASGARSELMKFLIEREREKRQALLDGISVRQAAAQAQLQAQQMEAQRAAMERAARADAEREADRARRMSDQANAAGLRAMTADAMAMPGFNNNRDAQRQLAASVYRESGDVPGFLAPALQPEVTPEPKRHVIETTDERGRPVRRLVSEDELAGGVPVYREPKSGPAPSYHWIVRNGQPMRIAEHQIRPGDTPYRGEGSGSGPTQGQLTADSFYARAKNALDTLEGVEGSISNWNRYVPNFLQTDAGQAYEQAKRQFVEAYLRKDSGAAIADTEYANADRTYFAQPGDSAATLKRKREARQKILDSLQHQGSGSGNGRNGGSGSKYRVTVR